MRRDRHLDPVSKHLVAGPSHGSASAGETEERRSRVMPRTFRILAAALVSLGGERAQAQGLAVLRVEVVEAASATPVAGAIVTLLTQRGLRADVTLADSAGRATLRVPEAGSYRVRAERVGFESFTTEPMDLDAASRSIRIELPARRVRLDQVVVRGRQRCEARPADAVRTAALWSEVQKALTATTLTSAAAARARVPMTVRTYTRDLTLTMRVQAETTRVREASGGTPFSSASPEVLSAKGFAHDYNGGLHYFAPDAALLVSDQFVSDHCFSVQRRARGDSVLLGLAFKPVAGRRVPEIEGTLWVDAASAELQFVEYTYTNLAPDIPTDRIGGRVEFARLVDGRWVVRHWYIRTPRLAMRPRQRVGAMELERRTELIGYREDGGTVTIASPSVARSVDTPPARDASPVISGQVFDSIAGAPLAGVRVRLVGTEVADSTTAGGGYRLQSPFAGVYTLGFVHPRLDLYQIGLTRQVTLTAGGTTRMDLAIPSAATLRRERCPDDAAARVPVAMLVGVVRDSVSGAAVPGARLRVSWKRAVLVQSGTLVNAGMDQQTIDAQANGAGVFALCGVPTDTTLRIEASLGERRGTLTRTIERGAVVAEERVYLR